MTPDPSPSPLIEDLIESHLEALTPAERVLAGHLMRNYPVAGLGPMANLAEIAGVSIPSVLRLVQKLGFRGYPEFQAQLRREVEARLESPIAKHDRWTSGAPEAHILNRFADAVLRNLSVTLGRIDHAQFDRCAALLADPARRVAVTGGRITHTLAAYLAGQLAILRPGVTVLPPQSSAWPPALADLRPDDVLILFDIRRYEPVLSQLAEFAAERGVCIVLLTDAWVSPASAHAQYRFSAQVEVPSASDSMVALLVLVETLLAAIQEQNWPETQARLEQLEGFYDRASLFRRS